MFHGAQECVIRVCEVRGGLFIGSLNDVSESI